MYAVKKKSVRRCTKKLINSVLFPLAITTKWLLRVFLSCWYKNPRVYRPKHSRSFSARVSASKNRIARVLQIYVHVLRYSTQNCPRSLLHIPYRFANGVLRKMPAYRCSNATTSMTAEKRKGAPVELDEEIARRDKSNGRTADQIDIRAPISGTIDNHTGNEVSKVFK